MKMSSDDISCDDIVGQVSKVMCDELKWQVDINSLKNKFEVEENIFSLIFSPLYTEIDCSGEIYQWRLALDFLPDDNHIELVLQLVKWYQTHDVNVVATVSFLNGDGKRFNIRTEKKVLREYETGIRFPNFIPKALLAPEVKHLIPSNSRLSILCRIKIVKKLETMKIDHIPSTQEFNDFNRLLASNEIDKKFSDLTVVIGENKLYLHKCILAVRSPVFENMFKHNMKENNENLLVIKDFDYETIENFFRFVYTGKNITEQKNIYQLMKIWKAADKYDVEELILKCEQAILDHLCEDNAVDCIDFASTNNCDRVKKYVIEWMSERLETFIEQPKYLKIFAQFHPDLFFHMLQKHFNIV